LRSDPDAICALYDRYIVRLVRFLGATGATPEAAWDAAQETFARLLERGYRGRLAPDGTAWPWLSVTARNLLRDWQRRGRIDDRARRRLGIERVDSTDEEFEAALSRIEGASLAAELEQALTALPAGQREAVTARVINGFDYDRYATLTGTSEQTVRRRVSRGLHAMRTLLEGGQR
jgi:RNA polymerase sigma-70 factor (ECF subfamily)